MTAQVHGALRLAAKDTIEAMGLVNHGDLKIAKDFIQWARNSLDEALALIESPTNDPLAKYRSVEGGRPAGWQTIVEWIADNCPMLFQDMDDLAIDTSIYGMRASRLLKKQGLESHSVPAPVVFAEEANHFEFVKVYPPDIIQEVITG